MRVRGRALGVGVRVVAALAYLAVLAAPAAALVAWVCGWGPR